jgi:ubiquinone biosynthesis protein Coq4
MQSTFKHRRKQLIIWLFKTSQQTYTKYFKRHKTVWKVTKDSLLNYPIGSLGKHLGEFLKRHNFEILPKLERHDCYHIITGYHSKVEDEIALQYLCFGNGKRSPYLFFVILLGTFILPDYYKYYYKSYKIGKQANMFYQFDYRKLLYTNLSDIQSFIFLKTTKS